MKRTSSPLELKWAQFALTFVTLLIILLLIISVFLPA